MVEILRKLWKVCQHTSWGHNFNFFSFLKTRGCLVCVFKQLFSVFKQHFTHFNAFFHPHIFPQMFSNNNFQFLNTCTKRALDIQSFLRTPRLPQSKFGKTSKCESEVGTKSATRQICRCHDDISPMHLVGPPSPTGTPGTAYWTRIENLDFWKLFGPFLGIFPLFSTHFSTKNTKNISKLLDSSLFTKNSLIFSPYQTTPTSIFSPLFSIYPIPPLTKHTLSA